ncbi:MAG TPA: FAD-binding oxidoreductase [Candidatus Polarisedimenticolaceae bacterium]|nr:FAD-binding oxidoreductase [Candidatus Polarisedimenticolaceae bacterium]
MKIDVLRGSLRGRVVEPDDPGYDDDRALYNGMIDKRPRAIAHCTDVADVIAAVRFAAEHEMLLAIRGGGHNGPGLGSCDGGLVLDLSAMNDRRVDIANATVRVGPGCTQGDVDHATHPFGLAVPAGIVSTTGIAGLTLGGGHGYLTRRFGLTIDNLLEADVVLADGSFVTCNQRQHDDLFWAVRGGGGNFGVVTSFKFRAQPVRTIYGGPVFFDAEHTREIMEWYRDWLPTAPREMYLFCGLKTVPDADPFPAEIRLSRICALIGCWSGPTGEGQAAFDRALAELPAPIFRHTGAMPFPMLQGLFDPLLPKGLQWYWKGDFVRELTDTAIDVHAEHGRATPTPLSLMHLYPIDGAVHDVAASATAWSYRDVRWSMVIAGIDPDPANAGKLTSWAKGYWDALRGQTAGGAYVNFMMEEGQDRVQATYGTNYARLVRIKTKYDPSNVFRVNQNIRPAAA